MSAARALAALERHQLNAESQIRSGRIAYRDHGLARSQARCMGLAAALRELAVGSQAASELRWWADQIAVAR